MDCLKKLKPKFKSLRNNGIHYAKNDVLMKRSIISLPFQRLYQFMRFSDAGLSTGFEVAGNNLKVAGG